MSVVPLASTPDVTGLGRAWPHCPGNKLERVYPNTFTLKTPEKSIFEA